MRRALRLSPSVVLSSLALFFALGGSAFALRTGDAKVRCPVGAPRAVAYVTGAPNVGPGDLPNDWSGAANLFGYRWSCAGPVQVRKSKHGFGFDIRFPGNPGKVAVATAASDTTLAVSVAPQPDGSFHVSTAGDVPNSSFPNRVSNVAIVVF
jgi:hypothetical protein